MGPIRVQPELTTSTPLDEFVDCCVLHAIPVSDSLKIQNNFSQTLSDTCATLVHPDKRMGESSTIRCKVRSSRLVGTLDRANVVEIDENNSVHFSTKVNNNVSEPRWDAQRNHQRSHHRVRLTK